jgi:hypothetical protein
VVRLETAFARLMSLAQRVRDQERGQRGPKVYSLHAPEVECIGKGKPHKPYEFGVKVKREPIVPQRVKAAIAYMLEQKPDLQAAAAYAGMSTYELRREMGKAHVRRPAPKRNSLGVKSEAAPPLRRLGQ